MSAEAGHSFRSSLGTDGLVGWSRQSSKITEQSDQAVETQGTFAFGEVDWQTLRSYYGWSALQYQGWARTNITVIKPTTHSVAIYTDGILEFWFGDRHFFGGDFYSYRRAPVIIPLAVGVHRFDVRLTRDVRAMGGSDSPTYPFAIRIELLERDLIVDVSKAILPELIDRKALSSSWSSISLQNAMDQPIEIIDMKSANVRAQNLTFDWC